MRYTMHTWRNGNAVSCNLTIRQFDSDRMLQVLCPVMTEGNGHLPFKETSQDWGSNPPPGSYMSL